MVFPGLGTEIPEGADWESREEVGLFQDQEIWEFGIFFVEIPIFFHACHFQGFGCTGAMKIPQNSL